MSRLLVVTENMTVDGRIEMLDDWFDPRARRKEGDGGDIVATGSITLVHALAASGLVDEYRLFTYPVAQGRGAGLFDRCEGPVRLELVESVALRTGLTFARYRPG